MATLTLSPAGKGQVAKRVPLLRSRMPTAFCPVMLQNRRGPDFSNTMASTWFESILMSRIFFEAFVSMTLIKEYCVFDSLTTLTTYRYVDDVTKSPTDG